MVKSKAREELNQITSSRAERVIDLANAKMATSSSCKMFTIFVSLLVTSMLISDLLRELLFTSQIPAKIS